MGLRASIAAGAKPDSIVVSDGRRVLIYRSKRGKVDFLASGPKRRLDDLSRRMQEGEALALHIAPNAVQLAHSDQTAVPDYFPASERLRAWRVQQWVNDLEARLLELRKTASTQPSATPLGGLAHVWFRQNSDNKKPVRSKWISLATWPRETVQPEMSSPLPTPPINGEQLLNDKRTSVQSRIPTTNERASEEETALMANPSLLGVQQPKLHQYVSSWVTRFEQMSQGRGLNLYVLNERTLGPIVQTYASTSKPLREIRQAWNRNARFSNYSPIQMWEDIMLWCLHNSPHRALRLLIATICSKALRPSRYVANDCLVYLTRHFLHRHRNPDRKTFHTLLQATHRFLSNGTDALERAQTIDDSVIYLLLRHCNDQQGQSLLKLCKDNNVTLHANTLLHFLDRSVAWGTISHSIDILRSIARSGFDMSSDQVQSACVKLIRTRVDNESEYRVQTKIVTEILEMGIVPRIAMCNAIILNAAEAGDFGTAWQMYEVAKANHLAPNSITYGVLLKGATLNGDFDVMEQVIREVLKDPSAMQDLRLLHDVLAAISSQNLQSPHSGRSGFRQMLALYRNYCSLAPLRELRMCGPELESPLGPTVKVQWPTPWILAQMVASYAHMRRGEDNLIITYNNYHSLVSERHPLISQLAQTDFTANAFMKAFGARSGTLKYCPMVIKHMLEDPNTKVRIKETTSTRGGASQGVDSESANSPSGTDVQPEADGAVTLPLKQALPTVRTWSILAAAYLRHGQRLAAKKVIKLMEDRGLRPDKVAWNTLISGYAGMQDVTSAVDALERMQAAGHETDARTLIALGRLWDRGRLLNALKSVTQPAESANEISPQGGKRSVEVMTSELETARIKQANAERYLAHIPSKLCSSSANEKEMFDEVSESKRDKNRLLEISVAANRPRTGDEMQVGQRNLNEVRQDPSIDDTVLHRLAGSAV